MARVFITGSADGLGRMAAQILADGGHEVILHARSTARAEDARRAVPQARHVVVGDLAEAAAVRSVAEQVNALGRFDAVIHNAAVGYQDRRRIATGDGLAHVFAINVLAPYLLTALITRPDRLVYLSSGMQHGGDPALDDAQWVRRRWNGAQAYSDSKLFDTMLAFAVARRWPDVRANSVDPGWVATKMGGAGAPGDLSLAPDTQAWLAAGDDPGAAVTGQHLFHRRPAEVHPATRGIGHQDALLDYCAGLTGERL